jgi:hypothetical protein
VHTDEFLAGPQSFFPHKTGGVHPFKEDGVIVFSEPFEQRPIHAGLHDKGQQTELPDEGTASFVVVHLMAESGKFGLGLAVTVLKTMENNLYALGLEGLYLIKNHDYAAVICGVRNIKSNNV